MNWVRKLVYEIMVAAPFLLLAIIAVRSRLNVDPYMPVDNTPELEARVSAYIQPVRNVVSLGNNPPGKLNADSVRRISHEWVEAYREGQLKPLTPGYFGESVREGIKGQVFAAKERLILSMIELAHAEAEVGNRGQSLQDLMTAYRLCQIAKFSDFMAVVDAARRQGTILAVMTPLIPAADADMRKEIAALAEPHPGNEIAKLLALSKGLYALNPQARNPQTSSNDVRAYKLVSETLRSGLATPASLTVVRSAILESEGELPRIYSQAKLAWQHETKLAEHFEVFARTAGLHPEERSDLVAMITP